MEVFPAPEGAVMMMIGKAAEPITGVSAKKQFIAHLLTISGRMLHVTGGCGTIGIHPTSSRNGFMRSSDSSAAKGGGI
jgi:hypothetical protein